MINQAGGAPQYPNNILQSGVQQNGVNQQNPQDKRAENNKPQENRTAESSSTQNTNTTQNRNFQEIAQEILAQRGNSNKTESQFTPAIERGAILDITV